MVKRLSLAPKITGAVSDAPAATVSFVLAATPA